MGAVMERGGGEGGVAVDHGSGSCSMSSGLELGFGILVTVWGRRGGEGRLKRELSGRSFVEEEGGADRYLIRYKR